MKMAASTTFVKRCLTKSSCSILQKYSRAFAQHRGVSSINDGKNSNDASVTVTEERDPFLVFSEARVQSLLCNMTGFDIMNVAGPKIVPMTKPVYKLLTTEQLTQEQQMANDKLRKKLQMPPYMSSRKPPAAPLSIDPELAQFDTSKYVFADVSFGLKDRERTVTVRDVDGTLRIAPWDVKERLNQIYNPREGRKVIIPSMFKEANLERMIKEKKYIYILDRACCQFEPDDPDYIRTTRRVYSAVDSSGDFQMLWSTRHFGPMTFYLVWHHMIDRLLEHLLNSDKLQDAEDLVHLFIIVHPDSPCAIAISTLSDKEGLATIKAYVSTQSKNKDTLELSVQSVEDLQRSAVKKESTSLS